MTNAKGSEIFCFSNQSLQRVSLKLTVCVVLKSDWPFLFVVVMQVVDLSDAIRRDSIDWDEIFDVNRATIT